jgi:DNA-directed RNA polymerase specialized sigma subunit
MEIAEHLAEHERALRGLAHKYARGDEDLREDCYQAGILALVEAHEGPYDHSVPLLAYKIKGVREAMIAEARLVFTEYRYGITEDLDELQEVAEEQGRDRLRLETLYEEAIPGIRPIKESSLSLSDEELAQELRASLTDEELEVLDLSLSSTKRGAARSLELPEATYRYKLKRAVRLAREVTQ